jgi:hypothetical protein
MRICTCKTAPGAAFLAKFPIVNTFRLLLPLSALLLWACNQSRDYLLPHTLTVFPADSGLYRISLVLDTTYNTQGPVADLYYKKEVQGGFETDLSGRRIQVLSTFRSPLDQGAAYQFQPDRVWSQHYNPEAAGAHFAERMVENVRQLVLKFPVHPSVSWNGNLYNTRGDQIFRYQNVDTTVTAGGLTFEHCVVVLQKAPTQSFISQTYAYEVYAPEVGLIKKYDRTLVFDGPQGQFNPDKSRIYIEELVEYGRE